MLRKSYQLRESISDSNNVEEKSLQLIPNLHYEVHLSYRGLGWYKIPHIII